MIIKNISPFNNKTDMPSALFAAKKILAFWFCYIAGLFLAEGIAILLHFALGKNMLVGDVFDNQTITLIIYYGYAVVIAVALLYWKLFVCRKNALWCNWYPESHFDFYHFLAIDDTF